MALCEWQERLCKMLYDLRVTVEANVVDDVTSVHIMHLGMLHGLLSTASRLDAGECTNDSRRFWGLRKAATGRVGMAFLHRSSVWRMVKYFFRIDGMFGRAGLYVNTKGILWLPVSVRDLSFLCRAFDLGASRALLIAA